MNYLRNAGQRFAQQYPKIAKRLELDLQGSSDPHVERLLESFAFLTGKIQRDLDDQFPRVAQNLLNVLYPHMMQSMPSTTTLCFKPDPDQAPPNVGIVIPRYYPMFAEVGEENEACWYRITQTIERYPLEVEKVRVCGPSDLGLTGKRAVSEQCLHIKFEDISSIHIYNHMPKKICMHLSGDPRTKHLILQALLSQENIQILCGDLSKGEENMEVLPRGSLVHRGFEQDESLLLLPETYGAGHRLLDEFFHYPDKYMYLDVENIPYNLCEEQLDLVFSLPRDFELKNGPLDKDTIMYGCAPAVNLFPVLTEPVSLKHTQVEYRLVGDYRRENSVEIHSIHRVLGASDDQDEPFEMEPYFSLRHQSYNKNGSFWHARLVPMEMNNVQGTDVLISFVDAAFNPITSPVETVYGEVICTNRAATHMIGANTTFANDGDSVEGYTVTCIDKPTSQVYPALDGRNQWKLISSLALSHLSLADQKDGLKRLQETLLLHCRTPEQYSIVDGLEKMTIKDSAHRFGNEAWRGFVQGMDIDIHMDEQNFAGTSSFLFSEILSYFFGEYAGMNSFTRLNYYNTQQKGVRHRWPARSGNRALL